MTKITATWPEEFKSSTYLAYWNGIQEEFGNSLGNLETLIVDIRLVTLLDGEQREYYFEANDNMGTLVVYFVRYMRKDKLTEVSTPVELYTYIRGALRRVAEDFK